MKEKGIVNRRSGGHYRGSGRKSDSDKGYFDTSNYAKTGSTTYNNVDTASQSGYISQDNNNNKSLNNNKTNDNRNNTNSITTGNDNSYLPPTKPKRSNMGDTYGGISAEDDDEAYNAPFKDIINAADKDDINNNNSYLNPTSNPKPVKPNLNTYTNKNQNDTPNTSLTAPHRPPVPPKPKRLIPNIEITDTTLEIKEENEIADINSEDGYMLPRHGSNVSSKSTDTNASTSSTTPLKYEKSDRPQALPRHFKHKKAQAPVKNIYKPANINETDV